ncbi:MAG: ATP-dependent Clp protease ATP-binding subunit ClpX, partial [Ignavibacteria bacterium]|nr:ATP-dependent Clp protease ATP-binding subunit ClpX [Ignavibacteria bacterium]
ARNHANVVGYGKEKKDQIDKDNLLQYISPADLKKFGLIPEIVGRLPILTYLHPLTPETLKRIITEPKNALVKQFTKLFEMDGVNLIFEEAVYDFVVEKSLEFKLGARGLRAIFEAILTDDMFELPSKKNVKELVISLEYAQTKFDKAGISKLKVA